MRRLAYTVAAITLATLLSAYKSVSFQSADQPPSPFKVRIAKNQGKPIPKGIPGIKVKARLSKPNGDGPFPAIVMMHPCSGINYTPKGWTSRLNDWGYVTFENDSLRARGVSTACGKGGRLKSGGPAEWALDAIGAVRYLRALPYVDGERTAIIGWSMGGGAALATVSQRGWSNFHPERFRAAVAYYPNCEIGGDPYAPTLVLIGDKDTEGKPEMCKLLRQEAEAAGAPLEVHIYPGVYHVFDDPGLHKVVRGHLFQYDRKAAEDSFQKVRDFLAKHIQQ